MIKQYSTLNYRSSNDGDSKSLEPSGANTVKYVGGGSSHADNTSYGFDSKNATKRSVNDLLLGGIAEKVLKLHYDLFVGKTNK